MLHDYRPLHRPGTAGAVIGLITVDAGGAAVFSPRTDRERITVAAEADGATKSIIFPGITGLDVRPLPPIAGLAGLSRNSTNKYKKNRYLLAKVSCSGPHIMAAPSHEGTKSLVIVIFDADGRLALPTSYVVLDPSRVISLPM